MNWAKKIKVKPQGYVGFGLMLVGFFGDNILPIQNQVVEFLFLAVAIIGFALAYDGVERVSR